MSRQHIEQTQQRLTEVEALQLSLKETQLELSAYRELLRARLALLRGDETPVESAPEEVDIGALAPAAPPLPRVQEQPERKVVAPPRVQKQSERQAVAPAPPPPSDDERRTAPRRKGNPVSVQVTDAQGRGDAFQGWVVDRSSGGVRLLVDQSVPAGMVLSVRPTKCHPSFPWVQVMVKSCRAERSSWNLGCQFVQKLSWAELQLFG